MVQGAPRDDNYYRIQRELLKDGLTRKAKLTQLPPHEEGQPSLWAIGIEGASPHGCPRPNSTRYTSAWPSTTSCRTSRSGTWSRSGARSGKPLSTSTSSPAARPGSCR